MCMRVPACVRVYVFECARLCASMCVHVCASACMCVCVRVGVCACACERVRVGKLVYNRINSVWPVYPVALSVDIHNKCIS